MPEETSDKQRAIEAFEKRTEERGGELSLNVFVCGPAAFDETGIPSADPGAVLRYSISERIQKLGHCPVWGEHLSTEEGPGGKSWVRRFNDADKEILFAVDEETDLVVIFPSSWGSHAELGVFCTHDKISAKLLVIFPSERRKDTSFAVGPLAKAGRIRRASIKFRDYGNPNGVWRAVRSEIERVLGLKTVRLSHGPK